MGLETYLLKIEFDEPVITDRIIGLLNSVGLQKLDDHGMNIKEENSLFFELRTENGLTEAHCMTNQNKPTISHFYVRFSVLSLKSVICQTFKVLSDFNDVIKIRVFDTEIFNHQHQKSKRRKNGNDDCYIPIVAEQFIQNKHGLKKREIICGNEEGLIIESGFSTLDFIYKNNLYEKYIGWFKNEIR